DPPALEQFGDPLVGQDHEVLYQLVGLGLIDGTGGDNRAIAVERELRLERLDLERPNRPARGQRGRCPAGKRERALDRGGRLRATCEELVELLVAETGI